MTFSPIDALLFDLGNVVIRIDFERVFARWAAHAGCDAALLREKFSHDEPYQRHERGEIEAAAYFASLRNSLGVEPRGRAAPRRVECHVTSRRCPA